MTETVKRTATEQDARLWGAARALVKDMNPYEARRFHDYMDYWPAWAKRDVELAYLALRRVREL